MSTRNMDSKTVEGFGREWADFDQSALSQGELRTMFEEYFEIFPWDTLPPAAVGFDLGCGSGRWAKLVAPRVGKLHCIDASATAIEVAKRSLQGLNNCEFHVASVDEIPVGDGTMDFGYSIGVFHAVPDPGRAIKACVAKLEPNAPFLLYTLYALENRPAWFRATWRTSDMIRRVVSKAPYAVRYSISSLIALGVYWPLARLALLLNKLGFDPKNVPLSWHGGRSFYTMRNDALDRFGTRLELRFTRKQIQQMMHDAGLDRIEFSNKAPYWCAIGYKTI